MNGDWYTVGLMVNKNFPTWYKTYCAWRNETYWRASSKLIQECDKIVDDIAERTGMQRITIRMMFKELQHQADRKKGIKD